MALDHAPHAENARRALKALDGASTGAEVGRAAVRAASALRVLLYEPADGFQGAFVDQTELNGGLRYAARPVSEEEPDVE